MSAPKIGIIDIETAPVLAHTFQLFNTNVGLEQIVQEWAILSFAVKPLGGKRTTIQYLDTSLRPDPLDDLELCKELYAVLHEYDLLIGHNARRFDLKKIRARLLIHGFAPPRPVRVIDTLEIAKRAAALTSNKLAWLSKYLSRSEKLAHGAFSGFTLWKECLNGNAKAWAEMKKYNIRDIVSLESVYLRIRPWGAGTHPNVAAYTDDEEMACPICGSTHLREAGFYHTNVSKYQQYQCMKCHAWSRGRYTINTKAKRASLLAAI